jgi:hypothetical protein
MLKAQLYLFGLNQIKLEFILQIYMMKIIEIYLNLIQFHLPTLGKRKL